MKFEFKQERVTMGNRIVVKITRENGEFITAVRANLDNVNLANDSLGDANVYYERVFNQAGQAGPGMQHIFEVTAVDQNGDFQNASLRWNDTL